MTFDIPPLMASSRSRSGSCSSSSSAASLDEDYLFQTYVPLSNLPTPPLSFLSNDSSCQQSPKCPFSPSEHLDHKLLGPAIHLKNLIPSSTTLTTPSTTLVHALLTRADLPLETIALAVCILDSLNSRFALAWRHSFPLHLAPPSSQSLLKEPHIDAIQPEIIVLSALVLAVKFVDDEQEKTIAYSQDWGREMWTCEQINYTQRLILENLSYRLLPLWRSNLIGEAMKDMERARQSTERAEQKLKLKENLYPAEPRIWDEEGWETETCVGCFEGKDTLRMSATKDLDEQLTPPETPGVENIRGMGTKDLEPETRMAFEGLRARRDDFMLPDRTLEPFPQHVDPAIEGLGLGF